MTMSIQYSSFFQLYKQPNNITQFFTSRNKGFWDTNEATDFFTNKGAKPARKMIDDLFEEEDKDGDGLIS